MSQCVITAEEVQSLPRPLERHLMLLFMDRGAPVIPGKGIKLRFKPGYHIEQGFDEMTESVTLTWNIIH